tara:strand:+ start:513 stop:1229 length:717 start_codon:yes stop_codon:yes gene_type:complete
MSLPKINVPEYALVVPSTDEEIKFRPFLVKEEKLLLMAQETGADEALYGAIKTLIKNCCFDKINVDQLPLFDIEYIFLNIRAKSVEEIANLKVICPDDEITEVNVKVDLTKLQVQMDDDHNPRIQLSEDIGILMTYPNLATIITANKETENETSYESMFKMIQNCMYQIWQGEETFDVSDYTDEDKKTFLESLNHNQFEKIQKFFETMPTLKHDVEVTNPKTKVKSTVTLEGMNSFFS